MYEEIYFHTYCEDKTGRMCKLSIFRKGFTGVSTEVDAGPTPFIKGLLSGDYPLVGGVYPTKARISLLKTPNFDMDRLYSDSDTEFAVQHWIDDQLDWIGFLAADGISEVHTEGYSLLEVDCFDGLTLLKSTPFLDETGAHYGSHAVYDMSFKDLIRELLVKVGLHLEFCTLVDRVPSTHSMAGEKVYDIFSSASGGIEGTDLNGEAFSTLKVGNYFIYREERQTGYKVAKVTAVDNTQTPVNTFATLSPPLTKANGPIVVSGKFVAPVIDLTKDVLAETKHSTRMWIERDGKVKRSEEDEGKEDKVPYYLKTDNTMMCWEILDSVARAWDVRIFQQHGMWIVESMDAHRLPDTYFHYDSDGTPIGRKARFQTLDIPACYDEFMYLEDGAKRFYQNAMKKVSVEYRYRFAGKGDDLISKVLNGNFMIPMVTSVNPATFVPTDWVKNTDGPAYYIDRPASWQYIELWADGRGIGPDTWLRSASIDVQKGDTVVFGVKQALGEDQVVVDAAKTGGVFGIYKVEVKNAAGEIYFLVNSGDDPEWTDLVFQSGNLKGRWEKGLPSEPKFLMLNHSTAHNASSSGGYSAMSQIYVESDQLPIDGHIEIFVHGVGRRLFNLSPDQDIEVRGYVPRTYIPPDEPQEVQYIENDIRTISSPVVWYTRTGSSVAPQRLRVTDVSLTVMAGDRNPGRLYEYEQDRQVKEILPTVTIPIGDESSEEIISSMFNAGQVRSLWLTRDGSLQGGTFGLLLARSIARRYLIPLQRLDGTLGATAMQVGRQVTIGAFAGKVWRMLSGDINGDENTVSGTFYELSEAELPNGGTDFGPGSITEK